MKKTSILIMYLYVSLIVVTTPFGMQVIAFSTTFNNISVTYLRSVLFVQETGVHNPIRFSSFKIYHRGMHIKSNTTSATSGAGTAYPFLRNEFTFRFYVSRCPLCSFPCRLVSTIVCPFSSTIISSFLRYFASNYTFDICKRFE